MPKNSQFKNLDHKTTAPSRLIVRSSVACEMTRDKDQIAMNYDIRFSKQFPSSHIFVSDLNINVW